MPRVLEPAERAKAYQPRVERGLASETLGKSGKEILARQAGDRNSAQRAVARDAGYHTIHDCSPRVPLAKARSTPGYML